MVVWRRLRSWAALVVAVVAAVSAVALPAWSQATLAGSISGPDWPHSRGGIKPDRNARYGRLPNGMRYVIYRNRAEGRSASMRLLLATGSLQERDDQLGLAHFVEHMAFRGSTNLEDGELARILKTEGFSFGSDVNAFTDYETTKYVLDLPSNQLKPIERAMFILREVVGNLTFDADAIEHERGVILGEERMRASGQSRAQTTMTQTAYAGTLYARRDPIGTSDSIRTAPRQALVDYYQDWYRPELATLIVVGDFDVDAMEKRIADTFGDWKPARPGPVTIVPYAPTMFDEVRAVVHVEKNLYEGTGVLWLRPYIDRPDDLVARTNGYAKNLAITALNKRFARAAQDPSSAFLNATVDYSNTRLAGNTTNLWVVPKPGRQKEAFLQAVRMVERLKADGVTATEVAEYIATSDAQMENLVRTWETRFSSDIAEDILSSLVYDNVFEPVTQLRADWTQVKPNITVAGVNERIALIFNAKSVVLNYQGSDPGVLDAAGLKAMWAEALATPDTAPAQQATSATWPYTSFGANSGSGAKVVTKVKVDQLNYNRYTLANGVTVNIKTSPLVKNQIVVKVRFVGGYRLFSPTENISLSQLQFYDIQDGGLGRLNRVQIGQALSTKTVSFDYTLDEDAAVMTGYTTRDSFAAQMQLMMAYATDAGFRPEMFDGVRDGLDYMYRQVRGSPEMTLGFGMTGWMAGGDPRYVLPPQEEMETRKPADIIAIYRRSLTRVPVEITITGDVREEAALDQVRKTFGNLPQVPVRFTPALDSDIVHMPIQARPQVFFHQGRADQYIAVAVFPTTDALSNPSDTRGLNLLAEIFNARLEEALRQRLGMAYDGQVSLTASEVMKGFGYLSAEGTIPADQEKVFYDTVRSIAAELVKDGIDDAELERARNPMIQYMSDDVKNNEDWQQTLAGLYGDPVLWDYRVDQERKYLDITTEDIQDLARRYLKPGAMLKVHSEPQLE